MKLLWTVWRGVVAGSKGEGSKKIEIAGLCFLTIFAAPELAWPVAFLGASLIIAIGLCDAAGLQSSSRGAQSSTPLS